jgi:hypothetical protein
MTQGTDDFLSGAERYARRDYAGAAAAWRPLLRGSSVLASVLPDAMAEVFERTDAVDLAEQVDLTLMKQADELNGATLAHVRAARRALRRGRQGEARELAEKVIRAWGVSREPVPSVAEMRRLVERLTGR